MSESESTQPKGIFDSNPESSPSSRKEDFKDEISWREYNISGLCQKCQNGFFE